ncbi:hypothetical protein TWF281_006216 [Arthrobotrys megalospora]
MTPYRDYKPKVGLVTAARKWLFLPSLLISLYLFTPTSGTPVGGSPHAGIANLAKVEVLNSREWDKLTVDNDHIVKELKDITDIASEFQDGGTEFGDYYPYQAGFLCDILERLNIANTGLEGFALSLLEYYNVPTGEVDRIQKALDSMDQSVKAIMNVQVREIGWKPKVPQESKSWIGMPLAVGTNGGRSPQDNTLDTSVVMKLGMGNSAIGGGAMGNSGVGNSLIADATPRYSSRGYIEGGGGGSKKPKERLNICDLTDGIAYFLKNDVFDHSAIFAWIWGKKELFGGEVLINAGQPELIEQTLSVATDDLVKARKKLKEYAGNLVHEIVFAPSLHPVKFPERLPRLQNQTEDVLDIVDEFRAAADSWASMLRKLWVAIDRITNDRVRSAFTSKLKGGGLQSTTGVAWWAGPS